MAFDAKLRKTLRVLLGSMLAMAVIIAGLTVSLAIIRRRDAQDFLNALRSVKVGTTTGGEALKCAQGFNADAYILKHTELSSGSSGQLVDVSPNECISANCTLSFAADAHTLWLRPFFYPLWKWPILRKWVPISGLSANVTVEHGIVTGLFVEMESIQQKEIHTARTVVTSKQVAAAWNIRRYTAFNTGGPGRTRPTVEVSFTPRSAHQNQDAALDFNLKCLQIGRTCSQCEILPRICEDEANGNWFYFEMSGDLLKNFQIAVNGLRLGCSEDAVVDRIGWGGITPHPLFDDKLPYRFPDGTMFGDDNPKQLIYYLKKRREGGENLQDQTVSFVFDKQDRLTGIISKADGIRSRP